MDVISCRFLFIGVNGGYFVRRISDIWVNGCSYVESVTFVRKFFTLWSLDKNYVRTYPYEGARRHSPTYSSPR